MKLTSKKVLLFALLGAGLGGFIGYLARPSGFLVGQLPFSVVITRGATLEGMDIIAIPLAQQSFNSMLIGCLLGGAIGLICRIFYTKIHQEKNLA